MNAKEAIQLVVEARTPDGWATTRGVYANYSNWPNEVEFYVKCPKCGLVHGNFKTLRDAELKKLCDTCNVEAINAIKDQVQDVIHDPLHKPKSMAKIVHEAEFDPFDEPPEAEGVQEPDPDDPDLGADATKAQIMHLLLNNWVDIALRDLADAESVPLADIEIDTRWSEREGNYDSANPGDATALEVHLNGEEFYLFRDYDAAEEYAIKTVKNDLESEPETYATGDWIKDFIDEDRLRQAIGDPNEGWDDEVRGLYYEDLLDKMVEEDMIEADDLVFFKRNGDKRIETKKRAALLDEYLEKYIETHAPEARDPWDYMEEMYSKDEILKEAIKLAGFDADAAAKFVVNSDGPANTLARYDHNDRELENGAHYYRIN